MLAYIINKKIPNSQKGYKIPFYYSPSSLSESISASYDQQNIPGRSAPVITYTSTGARQVSVSFFVSPDYIHSSINTSGYSTVKELLSACKALQYPNYNGSIVESPNCEFHCPGIDIDGVCTSVSIDYNINRYSLSEETSAEVSFTFLEVKEKVQGAINIINGTYYEGSTYGTYEEYQRILKPDLIIEGEGLSVDSPVTVEVFNGKIFPSSLSNFEKEVKNYEAAGDTSYMKYRAGFSGNLKEFDTLEEAEEYIKSIWNTQLEERPNAKDFTLNTEIQYIPYTAQGQEISSSISTRYITLGDASGISKYKKDLVCPPNLSNAEQTNIELRSDFSLAGNIIWNDSSLSRYIIK